jgi:hypothetical protein
MIKSKIYTGVVKWTNEEEIVLKELLFDDSMTICLSEETLGLAFDGLYHINL